MIALLSLSGAATLVVGQVASRFARREINPGNDRRATPRLAIRPTLNTGAIAAVMAPRTAIVLWAVMIVAVLGLLLLSEGDTGSLAPIGAGLAAGGATSNLIDSLRHRGTVDYLVIGSRIVNLPDLAITAGLIALTADVLS